VLARGPRPVDARLTLVLVHGRGGTAAGMLDLADQLGIDDVAFIAPAAAGQTWYPLSFLAPIPQNEPYLDSAVRALERLVSSLESLGVGSSRIAWLGFSQGACLALEFVARHAARYAAVAGLSGGLIGPPGTPRKYGGSVDGTPIFLGCSDVDAHIPLERVHETTRVFRALGGEVDERIYPGMGHVVSDEELAIVREVLVNVGKSRSREVGK
jgi:phospholipase/carboxylesterase